MKYKNVPPIQLIPVFEAAARHLSFKLAAEELCVSAPAVAQQVKVFEQWLKKPLFYRHTRALSLTLEGEYYFKVAQTTMKNHCQGHVEFIRRFEKTSLTLSAPSFVAQELLMPNYLKFSDYCPGTELRIETRMSYVDFDSETIDAAVRFGDGHWPDLNSIFLSKVSVAPVYGPNYEFRNSFTEISELYKHRLIYAEPEMSDWGEQLWPKGQVQQFDNIICDSYMAAVKGAADGLGVALGIFPTLNEWLNTEKLILPFPQQIETDKGFWFVYPKKDSSNGTIEDEKYQGLYRWVKNIFAAIPLLEDKN